MDFDSFLEGFWQHDYHAIQLGANYDLFLHLLDFRQGVLLDVDSVDGTPIVGFIPIRSIVLALYNGETIRYTPGVLGLQEGRNRYELSILPSDINWNRRLLRITCLDTGLKTVLAFDNITMSIIKAAINRCERQEHRLINRISN